MARAPKVPPKMGRPSIRTDKIIERIVKGLSAGTPLTQICAADDMPCEATVRNWMGEDEQVSSAIARAREVGFDAIAAEVLPIIDNLEEKADSRRVRAEYRLKLLAKWDPKRYGDRIDHTSSDGSMSPPKSLGDFYGERTQTGSE